MTVALSTVKEYYIILIKTLIIMLKMKLLEHNTIISEQIDIYRVGKTVSYLKCNLSLFKKVNGGRRIKLVSFQCYASFQNRVNERREK